MHNIDFYLSRSVDIECAHAGHALCAGMLHNIYLQLARYALPLRFTLVGLVGKCPTCPSSQRLEAISPVFIAP